MFLVANVIKTATSYNMNQIQTPAAYSLLGLESTRMQFVSFLSYEYRAAI
eukprot:GSA25T00006324001.1